MSEERCPICGAVDFETADDYVDHIESCEQLNLGEPP